MKLGGRENGRNGPTDTHNHRPNMNHGGWINSQLGEQKTGRNGHYFEGSRSGCRVGQREVMITWHCPSFLHLGRERGR